MAIAAVSISPLGVGLSVSEYVAAAISVLEAQDVVRWELDSMFTTLEGDPDALDDCGADLKTGGPRLAKQLRQLAWNRRPLRTSICAWLAKNGQPAGP